MAGFSFGVFAISMIVIVPIVAIHLLVSWLLSGRSSQNYLLAHDGNTFYRYNSRLVSCRYLGVILFRLMLILLWPGEVLSRIPIG